MSGESFVQKTSEWVRKPKKTDANLQDYFKAYKSFRWASVEKEFDWKKTRKINLVHEAVGKRHQSLSSTMVAPAPPSRPSPRRKAAT